MKCEICGKETDELYECPYCGRKVCKECTRNIWNDKVCKKCFEETPRQLEWETWELNTGVKEKNEVPSEKEEKEK